MTEQFTKSEEEIISAITNVPVSIPSGAGDGEWTTAIKRSLIALGTKNGYDVCTSGFAGE